MQGKEFRKYTMQDYEKVLDLRMLGLSQWKISNLTGISAATIWHWSNTKRKPRILYSRKMQRKLPVRAKKLTRYLAYILGVLVGDGSISKERATYRITLNVIDKDFAQYFSDQIEKWSGFKPHYAKRTTKSNHLLPDGRRIKCISKMHVIRIGSKQLGEFLLSKGKFGTYDWEVPDEIMKNEDEEIICTFLKGFFDSDGYVVLSGRSRRVEIEVFYTRGLPQIKYLLEKIGICGRIDDSGKGRGTKILRITKKDYIELFAKKIGFTLKRREMALEKLLASYKRDLSPYSKNEKENVIVEAINNNRKTATEISKYINRSLRVTHHHLRNLEKEGKLYRMKPSREKYGEKSNLWNIHAGVA